MDSFNPTTKTQAALTAALQAASAAGNPDIRPAHLLVALLDQTDGIAAPLLKGSSQKAAELEQLYADSLPPARSAAASERSDRPAEDPWLAVR